ncbi:hypothetical protein WJX79_002291 [Trebouxia sp. C0005]
MLTSAAPPAHTAEMYVAKTAVRVASTLCMRAQFQLQELKQHHFNTDKIVATTVLGYRSVTDAEFAELMWGGLSQAGAEGRHWIINPVDSTEGLENLRQYGVSLALLEQGKVVLAALACPNLPQAPILAIERTVQSSLLPRGVGKPLTYSDRKVETPKSVTNPQVQLSPADGIGCLFTAERGHGAYQAALFGAEGQSDSIRLPLRPFLSPDELKHCSVIDWATAYPANQIFSLVTSHESKFHSPGHAYNSMRNRYTCVMLDGQAQYGVLSRGDAKVMLTGGQDDIWDHAAGLLIAQESGLLVTNGSGASLDTSLGTKLNVDRGILATHSSLHADRVKSILGNITSTAHMQWIDSVIESGTVSSVSLEATADRYECGNYHDFVGRLRRAATASKFRLTYGRWAGEKKHE